MSSLVALTETELDEVTGGRLVIAHNSVNVAISEPAAEVVQALTFKSSQRVYQNTTIDQS